MTQKPTLIRQVMDWEAAIWAGLISGILSLIAEIILAQILLDSPWFIIRLVASIVMGPDVLLPPLSFDAGIFVAAILTQIILSMILSLLLATIIHRWGIIVGFLGGALFGLVVYIINYFTLSYVFPWFYSLKNWMVLVGHILFGAITGLLYESLEEEKFVKVED